MMITTPRHGTGVQERRGAAAAEFALVSVWFFLIVFGIIQFGRLFMVQHCLNEAARRTCRQAVVYTSTSTTYDVDLTQTVTIPALRSLGVPTQNVRTEYWLRDSQATVTTGTAV